MNGAGRRLEHASSVALDGRGVLVTGPSGSGKSALTLQMLARGATLVADDRTWLTVQDGTLVASPPDTIAGLVEARHFGILNAPTSARVPLVCVVDLARAEPARLPPPRKVTLLGIELDLVFGKNTPNLADALVLLLRNGRYA